MHDPLQRPNPLDAFDTLEDARERLEDLESLRSTSLPLVILGLVFASGLTWLDAQLVVWGAEPMLTRAPFSWILLTIWTANAFAGVQFFLLVRKAWLPTVLEGLPDRSVGDRRRVATPNPTNQSSVSTSQPPSRSSWTSAGDAMVSPASRT